MLDDPESLSALTNEIQAAIAARDIEDDEEDETFTELCCSLFRTFINRACVCAWVCLVAIFVLGRMGVPVVQYLQEWTDARSRTHSGTILDDRYRPADWADEQTAAALTSNAQLPSEAFPTLLLDPLLPRSPPPSPSSRLPASPAPLRCPPADFPHGIDAPALRFRMIALGERLGIRDPASVMDEAKVITMSLAGGHTATIYASAEDKSPLLRRIDSSSSANSSSFRSIGRRDSGGSGGTVDVESYGLASLPPLSGDALDLGGHVGTTAIALALLQPQLVVHTFEPMPMSFFFLSWNIAANGLEGRIVPRRLALTSREHVTLKLRYSADDTTSSRTVAAGRTAGNTADEVSSVPGITLASFLEACAITTVSFVKLECVAAAAAASQHPHTPLTCSRRAEPMRVNAWLYPLPRACP